MLFIVDIDQTLSTGFIGASFNESIDYYRTRGIAIPATVTTYLNLFQLPGVMQIHDALPGEVSELRTRPGKVTQSGETTSKNGRRMRHMSTCYRLFVAFGGEIFLSSSGLVLSSDTSISSPSHATHQSVGSK